MTLLFGGGSSLSRVRSSSTAINAVSRPVRSDGLCITRSSLFFGRPPQTMSAQIHSAASESGSSTKEKPPSVSRPSSSASSSQVPVFFLLLSTVLVASIYANVLAYHITVNMVHSFGNGSESDCIPLRLSAPIPRFSLWRRRLPSGKRLRD